MISDVPRSRVVIYLAGVILLLGLDLGSKSWAFQSLGYEYGTSQWNWNCNLFWGRFAISFRTSFNRGALFGIGQGFSIVFAFLSIVTLAGIIFWLFRRGGARSLFATLLMVLLSSGALGNLYDRLGLHGCTDTNGHVIYGVRDFIDCTIPGIRYQAPLSVWFIPEYAWPIFNFADVYLVTGSIGLVATSFFSCSNRPASSQLNTADLQAAVPAADDLDGNACVQPIANTSKCVDVSESPGSSRENPAQSHK